MLSQDKLQTGLLQLLKQKTIEEANKQWDKALSDYIFDASIQSQSPKSIGNSIVNLFAKYIDTKITTFVDDFGSNIQQWLQSIVWSNGKSLQVKSVFDFKGFVDTQKDIKDVNVSISQLADKLHQYFSQFTSF